MSTAVMTTGDFEVRYASPTVPPGFTEIRIKETDKMLLYEELAKARIRDLEEGVWHRWIHFHGQQRRGVPRLVRWIARRAHRR
jgi:hypothetical protein